MTGKPEVAHLFAERIGVRRATERSLVAVFCRSEKTRRVALVYALACSPSRTESSRLDRAPQSALNHGVTGDFGEGCWPID